MTVPPKKGERNGGGMSSVKYFIPQQTRVSDRSLPLIWISGRENSASALGIVGARVTHGFGGVLDNLPLGFVIQRGECPVGRVRDASHSDALAALKNVFSRKREIESLATFKRSAAGKNCVDALRTASQEARGSDRSRNQVAGIARS